jgi:DUF1009 family protein
MIARAKPRFIAILAGGGSLPAEIAASLAARGQAFHIIALDGEADEPFTGMPVTRVGWGGIGAMLKTLRKTKATDLLFAGRVRRPDLRKLRPDLGFINAVGEIWPIIRRGGGDDAVLRGVIGFFERRGVKVVGVREVAPELIVGVGALGRERPGEGSAADIALGLEIVRRLGPYDVGQGVVVADGLLEAVEASENTDAMLERVALARRLSGIPGSTRRGVLVKRPKPGQDLRIDLPAIGPDTVTRAADACLAGVAALAGNSIAARRPELIERADTAGLFVAGVEWQAPAQQRRSAFMRGPWRALTRGRPREEDTAEADIGCGVAEVLSSYDAGRTVVVSRKHVLAVDTGEGALATIARGARERQWGSARSRRRRGLVVLHGMTLTAEIVAAADAARLKGIALFAGKASGEAIAAAKRAGLFVLVRTWQRSG